MTVTSPSLLRQTRRSSRHVQAKFSTVGKHNTNVINGDIAKKGGNILDDVLQSAATDLGNDIEDNTSLDSTVLRNHGVAPTGAPAPADGFANGNVLNHDGGNIDNALNDIGNVKSPVVQHSEPNLAQSNLSPGVPLDGVNVPTTELLDGFKPVAHSTSELAPSIASSNLSMNGMNDAMAGLVTTSDPSQSIASPDDPVDGIDVPMPEVVDGFKSDIVQHLTSDFSQPSVTPSVPMVVVDVKTAEVTTTSNLGQSVADPIFDGYQTFIEGLISTGTYVASNTVLTSEYEWLPAPKDSTVGEICGNMSQNREAVFSIIGRVLPGSLVMGSSPEWNSTKESRFRSARYRLATGPVTRGKA